MSHFRCGVCNKVSSRELEWNEGEFTKKNFVVDSHSPLHYLCVDCKAEHEELMQEYAYMDDMYGWRSYDEVTLPYTVPDIVVEDWNLSVYEEEEDA